MERTVEPLRGSLPKLKAKLSEALKAVLPIVGKGNFVGLDLIKAMNGNVCSRGNPICKLKI